MRPVLSVCCTEHSAMGRKVHWDNLLHSTVGAKKARSEDRETRRGFKVGNEYPYEVHIHQSIKTTGNGTCISAIMIEWSKVVACIEGLRRLISWKVQQKLEINCLLAVFVLSSILVTLHAVAIPSLDQRKKVSAGRIAIVIIGGYHVEPAEGRRSLSIPTLRFVLILTSRIISARNRIHNIIKFLFEQVKWARQYYGSWQLQAVEIWMVPTRRTNFYSSERRSESVVRKGE